MAAGRPEDGDWEAELLGEAPDEKAGGSGPEAGWHDSSVAPARGEEAAEAGTAGRAAPGERQAQRAGGGGEPAEVSATGSRRLFVRAAALAAFALTLLQLVLGGFVTSMRAGDTDPNWNPLTPWVWLREVSGGQWYELRHRVLGGLVGLAAVALFLLARRDRRPQLRRAAFWGLLVVVFQGVLGGLRVLVVSRQAEVRELAGSILGPEGSIDPVRVAFAMAHALFAQVTLALFWYAAVVASRAWEDLGALHLPAARLGPIRRAAKTAFALIFVQVLLGAFARHAVYPQRMAGYTTLLFLHALLAILVTGLVAWSAVLTAKDLWGSRWFRRPALAGLFVVLLQLALGLGAWAVTSGDRVDSPPQSPEMLIRVGHLLNAALLLAILLLLSVRLSRASAPEGPGPAAGVAA